MRVDLHTHAAPASSDSSLTAATLGAAAAAAGVEAVALTDHGSGTDFDAAERAFAEHDVLLVPGREVSCALGHVLVLSTDRVWLAELPPRLNLPLDGAPAPFALVWAHPAGWHTGGAYVSPDPSRGAKHLHGVEILNGERLWMGAAASIASGLAEDLGLGPCGGSDAHDARGVGRCLTEAPDATNAASFVEALIAGAVRPVLSAAWAELHGARYERPDLEPYLG